MAREVLAKIQAAEAENAQKLRATQTLIEQWQRENEEKLASEKAASQVVVSEVVKSRQQELTEKEEVVQHSLFSNQQEAQQHFEQLYERNKVRALALVLAKVRESYGS